MNIPAKMLYGRMAEITELLGGDYAPELSNNDLRALATNMCQRIDTLECLVVRLNEKLLAHENNLDAHKL